MNNRMKAWVKAGGLASTIIWLVAVIGIIFRIRAFGEGRSLWLDEAMVASNYVEKSLFGLLTLPLANDQSAPLGFLAMSKFITDLTSLDEFTIRLVPLSFGIASVLLAAVISGKVFNNLLSKVVFVSVIAFSPVLIYYSVEFKQYSLDVFAVLFFFLLISIGPFTRKLTIAISLLILLITTSSLIAIPVFLIWAAMQVFAYKNESLSLSSVYFRVRKSLFPLVAGFLGSLLQLAHAFLSSEAVGIMRGKYSQINSFPPSSLRAVDDILWYPARIISYLTEPFTRSQVSHPSGTITGEPLLWSLLIIFLVLGVVIFRLERNVSFALAILLLPLILSQLQIYPVGGRLTLFAAPATALILAYSIDWLARSRVLNRQIAAVASTAIFVGTPFLFSLDYFREPNDSKDTIWALEEINDMIRDDEVLLYDWPNYNQIFFHQSTGYGPRVNTEAISMSESEPGSDWEPSSVGYWIISTHRVNEYEIIRDNLLERGYVEVCHTRQDQTFISRLRIESDAGYGCEFNR